MNRTSALIKTQSSKPGLRGKINANCIECIYDEKSGLGNWRIQVGMCTSTDCPLYSVRPVSSNDKGEMI